jgi:hypothetical protein
MTLCRWSVSLFIVLAFFAGTLSRTNAFAQNASPVSYVLESPDVVPGEPVFLRFVVHNTSAAPLKLDLGQDRKQSFVFDVNFPDGTTASDLVKPLRSGLAASGDISVAASERYTQTLLLNEWINFNAPGTYVVDVEVAKALQLSGGSTAPIPRFVTRVNVLPHDDQRLDQICARLTDQISAERSVGRARDLALALSYVRDPVAVPFLREAYERNRYVESEVIDGLERIGDVMAIETLISMLATDVSQDASWNESRIARARWALTNLEGASTDANTKRTIQLALAENR